MPENNNELGALWERKTKDGRVYMTGTINGQEVVVFGNDRATNPKAPQWRVYKSTPREQ